MFGAPVVADHPSPPLDFDGLAIELDLTIEDRVRVRTQELGPGNRRAVEEVPRQMVEGLVVVGEAQVPSGRQCGGLDAARGAAVRQSRVRDPDVGLRVGAQLIGTELALRGAWPGRI